jgi:hypothetical protein
MKKIKALFGFTRHSYTLLSLFLLTCLLIVYIWWPLVQEYLSYMDGRFPWYYYVDWLLLGIFAFMSISIMAHADLKSDALIVLVGLCGGLVIESWGTQTNLWHYYTAERPPLWIIPAWPIASLSIDRISRGLMWSTHKLNETFFRRIYWLVFTGFYALMLSFVAPTLDKSYTQAALVICALIILTPTDHRKALLVFAAGSALGYFLERWGTTRECWTYYTNQTPPVFAVFAHGMAALAFWRSAYLAQKLWSKMFPILDGKMPFFDRNRSV